MFDFDVVSGPVPLVLRPQQLPAKTREAEPAAKPAREPVPAERLKRREAP